MRMVDGIGRRGGRQTLLPLRSTRQLSNTFSCWYCDFKVMIFNEPLFRFGRRHSRYLRIWFSMGIGFSLAALFGITVIILYALAKTPLSYAGNARSGDFLFGLPFLITGMNISLSNLGYLCLSSVICIIVHEFGHALAAASEGVQMEYIAFFYALMFPGALVAFNHASLQALPWVASLRIYCAGIWHNAAFCGVCTLVLSILPFILNPFYIHGESPMVLDVHPMSPLSGYLSPRDVILSLDEFHIHNCEEWKHAITMLTERTNLLTSGQSSGIPNMQISYCVPDSLIKKSIQTQFEGYQTYCPDELSAFAPVACVDVNKFNDIGDNNNHHKKEVIHCLNAKDVVKLQKCGYNSVQAPSNSSGCLCLEEESCLTPLQLPGLGWVEITYSSLECLNRERSYFSDDKNPSNGEKRCLQTFVFVGDLMSMAHSIHLTSYRPRLSIYFIAYLPNLLEKLFTCAFHVSMVLALLNSLPVFFLDGESILEVTLLHYLGFLSLRMRRSVLRSPRLLPRSILTSFLRSSNSLVTSTILSLPSPPKSIHHVARSTVISICFLRKINKKEMFFSIAVSFGGYWEGIQYVNGSQELIYLQRLTYCDLLISIYGIVCADMNCWGYLIHTLIENNGRLKKIKIKNDSDLERVFYTDNSFLMVFVSLKSMNVGLSAGSSYPQQEGSHVDEEDSQSFYPTGHEFESSNVLIRFQKDEEFCSKWDIPSSYAGIMRIVMGSC